MIRKMILVAAVTAGFASSTAWSQALPKTHLRVVGSISSLTQYKDYEIPFWTKQLSDKSGGAVTADQIGKEELWTCT